MAIGERKHRRIDNSKLSRLLGVLRAAGVTKYADGEITVELAPTGVDMAALNEAINRVVIAGESHDDDTRPVSVPRTEAAWLKSRARLPDDGGDA